MIKNNVFLGVVDIMDILKLKRNRDAWATIRGYVYQVDLTIEHWINLRDNEILELERGEDIDVVTALTGPEDQSNRVFGQVKHREKNITLRSSEALEALVNYYEHIQLNPKHILTFRFITNAEVGKERPALFPNLAAIAAWESIRKSENLEEEISKNIKSIRDFLALSIKPDSIDKETWKEWNKFLSNYSDKDFYNFIKGFTWSTGNTPFENLQSKIENRLIEKNIATNESIANNIYEKLFLTVFKKLSVRGIKSLTRSELEIQAGKVVSSQEDINLLNQLRYIWIQLEEKVERIERTVNEHQDQVSVLQDHIANLREEVGFNATIDLSVQKTVLDIPALDHVIEREETVSWFIKKIGAVTWYNLTGDYGSGKTTLAALIAKKMGLVRGWIRLRDLSPSQAHLRIENALVELTGLKVGSNWTQWYQDVCHHLSTSGQAILVFDDLPRTTGTNILDEKLMMLARACDSFGIKILSTSGHPLSGAFYTSLGEEKVKQYEVLRLKEIEVANFFQLKKAPEHLYCNNKFIAFITSLTLGHPVLVSAAIRYFNNKDWVIENTDLESLFKGKYTENLIEEIQSYLFNNLEDDETREFLYRLTLVGTQFDREQIQKISEVPPPISRPFEKVVNVSGLWLQKDTESNYLISPLLKPLGQLNLDTETIKNVNHVLGLHIVHKRKISPLEGLRAIGYFVAAEAYKEAGTTLILSIDQLDRHNVSKDIWGFTSLWSDTPLPDQMDYETKLLLRVKQIMIYKKMGKSTKYLLSDLDLLLSNAENFKSTLANFAMLYAASLYALNDVEKANRYLVRSLPILEKKNVGMEEELSELHPAAALIWVTGVGVSSSSEILSWLETLRSLTSTLLTSAIQSDFYADCCINICDRIWTLELEKEDSKRDWQKVLNLLEDISTCSEDLKLELLLACAIRGRIIVNAEYLNKLADALNLANNSLNRESFGVVEQYVIKDAIGRQYVYRKDYMEAVKWLTDALKIEINYFPINRVYTNLELSKAVGEFNGQLATFFTQQAIELSMKDDRVPENILIKAMGEHLIANWLDGRFSSVITIYEEAVDRLLVTENKNDGYRSVFMSFGHALGYICSEVVTGRPPQSVPDGGDYVAPFRGFFSIDRPLMAKVYKSENDWYLAAHLGKVALHYNNRSVAVHWILKAFDLAKTKGAQGSIGMLGVLALPLLLEENEFALALDVAIEIQMLFTLNNKNGFVHSNYDEILGPKPNKAWDVIEENGANISIILSILKLLTLNTYDTERTHELAKQLQLLLSQIKITASLKGFWDELSNAIGSIFFKDCSFTSLVAEGNRITEWESIRMTYYLAAAIKASPKDALEIFNSVVSFFEGTYKSWEELMNKIINPFFYEFWTIKVSKDRKSFTNPNEILRKLEVLREGGKDGGISQLLAELKNSIG
jgi:hypothetical protein